ncbi:MAG: choloylglycine hydrolase family protein [Ruminococcaceae bacterium]|nr:choloylglycine hydrolase family protein [Oscillospiraceae bacterium]
MCTAISMCMKENYFGRNLDFEFNFGEKVTITPRNYYFKFRNGKIIKNHYAMIGMAVTQNNYPLYFDATNEKGVSIAGLNFPDNAMYGENIEEKDNVASFEVIPWILTQCGSLKEAGELAKTMNITNDAFSDEMPPSPLHFIIADKSGAITVEQTQDGLKVYENPVGVLTNNPTFDMQMWNLSNYMLCSAKEPLDIFSSKTDLKAYSRGMGGIGLPGDLSSASRFVKACFLKLNSVCLGLEQEKINHFFHILYSVFHLRGSVQVGTSWEITNYSSCCNTDRGIYYYTTYKNSNINAVDMYEENLDSDELVSYGLIENQNIDTVNKKKSY